VILPRGEMASLWSSLMLKVAELNRYTPTATDAVRNHFPDESRSVAQRASQSPGLHEKSMVVTSATKLPAEFMQLLHLKQLTRNGTFALLASTRKPGEFPLKTRLEPPFQPA